MITGEINKPVKMTADKAGDWLQAKGKNVNLRIELDGKVASFTPSQNDFYVFHCGAQAFEVQVGNVPTPPDTPPVEHECPAGQHWDPNTEQCVENTEEDEDILYDSLRDSKLHDGKVRTVESEGSLAPNGKGLEGRASGNPQLVVNADGTFSLVCEIGHGRFYGYCLNYNATMILECAFWNQTAGQDLSLKMRSRHNEGGAENNRFGGYGLALDRAGWNAKRELFHNEHDQSVSGKLPETPQTQKYFTVEFTVKDEGGKVRQIGKYNGKEFMNKTDDKPFDYMVDEASFQKQSYFWVRSNIDSGKGEIRIKRLRIVKA